MCSVKEAMISQGNRCPSREAGSPERQRCRVVVRRTKAEAAGGQRTEDRRRKTVDRGPWTEDGRPSTVHCPLFSFLSVACTAPRSPISELRSPISELRTSISELRSPNSELRSPNSDLRSPNSELRSPNSDVEPLLTASRLPLTSSGFQRFSFSAFQLFSFSAFQRFIPSSLPSISDVSTRITDASAQEPR
jgi:hypothetical protein